MTKLLWFFIPIFFLGCGSKDEDQLRQVKQDALYYLDNDDCPKALTELKKITQPQGDIEYIKIFASAQACQSQYSTLTFFTDDVEKISATPEEILNSLTTISTSELETDDYEEKFENLQDSIHYVLTLGNSIENSHDKRVEIIGTQETQEIESLALYMVLVQLGRFFHYYGNTDIDGIKGNGSGSNLCLTDYTTPIAIQGVNLLLNDTPNVIGGSCEAIDSGHPELENGATDRRKKLCHGVITFNNFIDLTVNLLFSGDYSDQLNNLRNVILNSFLTTACGGSPTDSAQFVCVVKDQESCEDDSLLTLEHIEAYYVSVFETLFD